VKKILVGLSGGVDSFMSAYYLQRAGWEVFGAYLEIQKNFSKLKIIKELARKLQIPLEVVDCKKEFNREVIDSFIKNYQQGQTPNPCVFCNPEIKFKFLLKLARKKKIFFVATGHYARIELSSKVAYLKIGLDKNKDQSYFLYRLKQAQLRRIIFPLGEKNKNQIKNEAEKLGFYQDQERKESQDICFFKEDENLAIFLRNRIKSLSGEIIDEQGKILGIHQGLEKYTLGQRRGLELSAGPYFVINKNFKKNQLLVSKNKNHPLLWKKELFLKKVSWIQEAPSVKKDYFIKIRYGKNGSLGKIIFDRQWKKWKIILAKEQWAPAAGQSAVIYEGEKVLGGGIIR